MPFRRAAFTLTPPTWPVFAIALVLTALGALVHYRVVLVPALAGYSFEMVLCGAVLLIAGAMLRGI